MSTTPPSINPHQSVLGLVVVDIFENHFLSYCGTYCLSFKTSYMITFRLRDVTPPSIGFLDTVFSDTIEEGRHLLKDAYSDLHLQRRSSLSVTLSV